MTAAAAAASAIATGATTTNITRHLISLIHATKTLNEVHQIHAQTIKKGLTNSSKISTQLLSASSLQKSPLHYTLSLFHDASNPKNTFTFNSIIRGLASNSHFHHSLSHFSLMLRRGIRPDRLTFPFVLRSVSGLGAKVLGGIVHGLVLKLGLVFDSFVEVSVGDMCVKLEQLGLALKVFDESCQRREGGGFGGNEVLLWNVVINGCCEASDMSKEMELFEAMPERSASSWNVLL